MIHTLYKTTNLVNKKFYLGVHTTEDIAFGCDNWEDPYVGSGHNIWAALKKYGRDKFQVEIVAYFDEEDYAYDAEKDIVTEEWLTKNKGVCYNINVGGNKPPRTTSESAKKANVNRKANGYRHSEEHNEKVRLSMLGKNKGKYDGEDNPFFGKKHSKESNQKNREKHLGIIPWNKGKKQTENKNET